MKRTTLNLLACPRCHSRLTLDAVADGDIDRGTLCCDRCGAAYPILYGIPQFIQQTDLTGDNRRFSYFYDWFSWVYRPFLWAAFAYMGTTEDKARREILDRLEPGGGRVLEVSIGPGVNLPYLIGREDVSDVIGLDISPGQLKRCQSYLKRRGWIVDLLLGSAEQLPFIDEAFESVFHIGGINFFNDKQAAINEMIRVAKPGARILIVDEKERAARAYQRAAVPGLDKHFWKEHAGITAPIDLVPETMQEISLYDVWKGWFYCIEFRKPQ